MREIDPKIFDIFVKFGLADLRIGQTIMNFSFWHEKKYGTDIFYIENSVFLERFQLYYLESFENE